MRIAVEDFGSYAVAESFEELALPSSRILRLPAEQVPRTPLQHVGPEPSLRFGDRSEPVELRVAKVTRALCVRRGLIVDLDTGRILPDVFRKPVTSLPATVEVDLTAFDLDDSGVDWDRVPARGARGPGYYADSRHTGYGHALLEGLSRCWALDLLAAPPATVVAHKAASHRYGAWFAGLGVDRSLLQSTRRGPLRLDDLYVPSGAYVLDRGMSPRFLALARRIAHQHSPAEGAERLYVSRRHAAKRRLTNELEIEALFASYGFRIFHPEEHDCAEQIRAFAAATHVAGPVGSGLYTIAFACPATGQLILAPGEFYTRNDLIIAGGRRSAPLFVFGTSASYERAAAMVADWRIDPKDVTTGIETLLGS